MKAYTTSIIVIIAVFFIHLGGQVGFYQHYTLFDIIPHSLAGFGAGFFFAEFFNQRLDHHFKWSVQTKDFFTVGCVFAVAIFWEIFEIITNTAGYLLFSQKYFLDTTKDISMGVIGAIIAVMIFRKFMEKK